MIIYKECPYCGKDCTNADKWVISKGSKCRDIYFPSVKQYFHRSCYDRAAQYPERDSKSNQK